MSESFRTVRVRLGALAPAAAATILAVACGAATAVMSKVVAGLGIAALVVGTLRRRPVAGWGLALLVSLLLYERVWQTAVFRGVGFSVHLSDLVVIALVAAAGEMSLGSRGSGHVRVAVAAALGFAIVVLVTVVRSFPSEGTDAVTQARHLFPYVLVFVLPLSARFRSLSAAQIADCLAVGGIALGIRSTYLVLTGHAVHNLAQEQRIYQTWEPFLASAIFCVLLGCILGADRIRVLHAAALCLVTVPIVFGFFRTAWVLLALIVPCIFLAIRNGSRRFRLVVGGAIASVACAGVLLSSSQGTKYATQVALRGSELTTHLDSYRSQEYGAVWNEIRKDVVFGSGFGTHYVGDWTIYSQFAHNAYEWLWWRVGLLGLGAFVVMWLAAIGGAVRATRLLDGLERGVAVGLIGGCAFTVLAANFHENFENFQTNILIVFFLSQLLAIASGTWRPEAVDE